MDKPLTVHDGISPKGHTFTHDDLPRRVQQTWSEEKKTAWVAQQNARFKIVARCNTTGREFIAEELDQRAMNELSPKARRAVGGLMLIPAPERTTVILEVLGAFNADGSLKIPFEMVE